MEAFGMLTLLGLAALALSRIAVRYLRWRMWKRHRRWRSPRACAAWPETVGLSWRSRPTRTGLLPRVMAFAGP